MLQPFHKSYYGHALSKVSKYVNIDEKIVQGLNYTSIKGVQANIQKFISCLNLCTFVPSLDFLDPFFDLKYMHTCSSAQIKIEYASEYSISDLFQIILQFESWSFQRIMFLVRFCVMVNWNKHHKYNGFPLFKWKLQVCKLSIIYFRIH